MSGSYWSTSAQMSSAFDLTVQSFGSFPNGFVTAFRPVPTNHAQSPLECCRAVGRLVRASSARWVLPRKHRLDFGRDIQYGNVRARGVRVYSGKQIQPSGRSVQPCSVPKPESWVLHTWASWRMQLETRLLQHGDRFWFSFSVLHRSWRLACAITVLCTEPADK